MPKNYQKILKKNLNINYMINNQIILFKFIQIHTNVNWYDVSYKYILSENFIRKFQNKVFR